MQGKLFGLLIVLVGAVLLLSHVGVVPYMSIGDLFGTFWPVILIYFGVVGYAESFRYGRRFVVRIWPTALLVVGAVFQLENLGIVTDNLWNLLVPAAFIVLGIGILFGKKSFKGPRIYYTSKDDMKEMKEAWKDDWQAEWSSSSERPRRRHYSMLGDLRLGGANFQLENARIEQKVGSIKLDLRDTAVPLGETTLEIECKLGDVDVYVPDDLAVEVHAQVKIGDIKVFHQRNSGRGTLHYTSENYAEAERKVKLFILVKIGDIDVKQVG